MFYSIKNGKLITSGDVHVTPGGAPVSNFTTWLAELPSNVRLGFVWFAGFVESVSPGEYYAPVYRADVDTDSVVQEWVAVDSPVPQTYQLAKILLRKNLRDLGLEEALNTLIASSPEMAADWADAVTLDSDDPKVLGALAQLKSMELLDDDQIVQIMEASRSEYQV